jgi:hypothetical protein
MPIHLNYQGTICPKCGVEFISHRAGGKCPVCAALAVEIFDFVPATIATMKDHKRMYGNYFPDSWFSGSTADTVQGIIFELFDNFEIDRPKDFLAFAVEQLGQINWEENQQHLASQAEEIALEVFEIYKTDPDFKGDNLKNKPLDPKLESINPKLDISFDIDNLL